MPNLEVLREVLAGDGSISAREMNEVRAAVRVISAIELIEPKAGMGVCSQCGKDTLTTEAQAPAVCHNCWFWLERCAIQALISGGEAQFHPGTFRMAGLHYAILPGVLDLRKVSELVTVLPLLPTGVKSKVRIVTARLYCHGDIPEAYREYLKDNCAIVKGDPYKLGMGVHEGDAHWDGEDAPAPKPVGKKSHLKIVRD